MTGISKKTCIRNPSQKAPFGIETSVELMTLLQTRVLGRQFVGIRLALHRPRTCTESTTSPQFISSLSTYLSILSHRSLSIPSPSAGEKSPPEKESCTIEKQTKAESFHALNVHALIYLTDNPKSCSQTPGKFAWSRPSPTYDPSGSRTKGHSPRSPTRILPCIDRL